MQKTLTVELPKGGGRVAANPESTSYTTVAAQDSEDRMKVQI